jgi:hypothetical protein
LRSTSVSLEEIFLQLTGGSAETQLAPPAEPALSGAQQ